MVAVEIEFPPQALERRHVVALLAVGITQPHFGPRPATHDDVRNVHAVRHQVDAQPARPAFGAEKSHPSRPIVAMLLNSNIKHSGVNELGAIF
jgi:hypothetical protein